MKPRPILYVEDDENDVFLMQRAFEKTGLGDLFVTVKDGDEALKYLAGAAGYGDRRSHPLPCLILMDLNLPRRSGFEVLTWVRDQPALRTLPVIVFSSSSQEIDVHRAYETGANAYLVKPTSPAKYIELLETIKQFWLRQIQQPPEPSRFSRSKPAIGR